MILEPAFALFTLALTGAFLPAAGEHGCQNPTDSALSGSVQDSTSALVPGTLLSLDGSRKTTSGVDGSFAFACVSAGTHHLLASAGGFAGLDLTLITPAKSPILIMLQPEVVQTNVGVSAAEPGASTGSMTISGGDLQTLADDPDDLLRELQQLGAANGGSPANTTITVDGFQGASKLPPKSSIAYIKVNPDLYSAEYRDPPYDGGRVEIYTRPGQSAFHGALFTTNGSPWENARDPFSPEKAAIGKQRYGFELTGPVQKGSDFALDLEHRSIDNFAVVNAVTLDSAGDQVNTVANVPTPQALWVGEARLDWQLGATNTLATTYSANVNSLENLGVGGTMLAETGYDSGQYEHTLRFTDVTVVSPRLMHEARVSLRWDGQTDTPLSSAPQINVAGTFTSGGATIGPEHLRGFSLEADDDAILTTKKHTLQFGTQLMLYDEHQQLTTNFNGTYTFGGGTAPALDLNNMPVPGQAEIISGIEQYRRALLNLAGGTPTAFSNVVGTPAVSFKQLQDAVYLQDQFDAGHGMHISAGLRYSLQNDPVVLNGVNPRIGVMWAPGRSGAWTLHGHMGMFSIAFNETDQAEVLREDGSARVTSTVYNPVYGNPFAGATPIHSARQFSPHIANIGSLAGDIGGTRVWPKGYSLSFTYSFSRIWNDLRSENINAPLDGEPTGARALGIPNLDLLQMQNSARSIVDVESVSFNNSKSKYVHFYSGGDRLNIVSDTDDDHFFTPQNAFSDAGEFAHISNFATWQVYGSIRLYLPEKLQLSTRLHASGDQHYNITTGFDNNGDGNFNDRPQYATPNIPGAIPTPFGLLTNSGGAGAFPRNKGVLPWTYYLDENLQRDFTLSRDAKAEHQQLLSVNVRSSNLINHTNITQVGGVLGSPLFGVPYQADNGRRVEAGLRYSF